jgi:hypothetical protein
MMRRILRKRTNLTYLTQPKPFNNLFNHNLPRTNLITNIPNQIRKIPLKHFTINKTQQDLEHSDSADNTLNLISTWTQELASLHWDQLPSNFLQLDDHVDLENPSNLPQWFPGGKLNIAYNCLVHNKKDDDLAVSFSNLLGVGHGQLTYKQLRKKVNRTAGVMKSLGLGKGDTVIIMMSNSIEMVISMLACLQLGIVFKNLPPGLGPLALGEVLSLIEPQMLIIASSESKIISNFRVSTRLQTV